MEDRLKQLKESGGKGNKDNELELGKLVKDVDAELVREREKQASDLEARLAALRKKKQLEAEKRRREREEQENERVQ
jgi:hypothetical protein